MCMKYLPLDVKQQSINQSINSPLSDPFEQEMGVPQGSILYVTLFSIKINSLAKTLQNNVEGSLYVSHPRATGV